MTTPRPARTKRSSSVRSATGSIRGCWRNGRRDVIDGDEAYWIGGVFALLGERATALAWLRRAVDLGDHNAPWFARDRNYQQLRGDPEYERIMDDVRRRSDRYRQLFA